MPLLPTTTAMITASRPAATDSSSRGGRRLRLAASLALLASSALLLLAGEVTGNRNLWYVGSAEDKGEGDKGQGEGEEAEEIHYESPSYLLTNLARVDGTKSFTEAKRRAARREKASSVTPVYWHQFKSGGTSVKSVLVDCLALTTATNMGVMKGHDEDTKIGVMRAGSQKYVNVDTVTRPGIKRAASLRLAESGLADAIVTPLIGEVASTVFSPSHRGALFTVFRHPVDRLVSQYYYLQEATWESVYDPDLGKKMTVAEYAGTPPNSNRITHQFVDTYIGHFTGELNEEILEVVKEVVKERTIVGLQENVEESVGRFITYFGDQWERPDGNKTEYEKCMRATFHGGSKDGEGGGRRANQHKHPKVMEGSDVWNQVAAANKWDMQLFEYARKVYEEQGRTMFGDDRWRWRWRTESARVS